MKVDRNTAHVWAKRIAPPLEFATAVAFYCALGKLGLSFWAASPDIGFTSVGAQAFGQTPSLLVLGLLWAVLSFTAGVADRVATNTAPPAGGKGHA